MRQALRRPRPASQHDHEPAGPLRVAVVGVGQEFNGDDAAGVLVARSLAKHQRAVLSDAHRPIAVLVVEAAHAPENCTGAIRRFAPDLVILVDAAEMGDPPGTVRWLDWREAGGLDASTHAVPPSMLARYLVTELSCDLGLICIQVQDTAFGAPVSPPVHRAIRSVSRGLSARLLEPDDPGPRAEV